MEEALRSLIVANVGVTTFVSSRVYWGLAPQTTTGNYVTMHRIGGVREYNMETPSGLVQSRVQVDIWGGPYSQVKLISRAIVAAIGGFRGTQNTIQFGGIFIDGERDDQTETTGDTATRYRNSLDLIVWHSEK
jgi:hypothetical protein